MPQIQIDATKLYYSAFLISGTPAPKEVSADKEKGSPWFDGRIIQKLDLKAATYNFQIASGEASAFNFTVNTDGTISYDPKFGTFLSGQGTSQLTVNGLEVTIDARYILGEGILVNANSPNPGFISFKKVRLLPSKAIAVIVGSAMVSSFTYGVDLNGKFTYQPEHDISQGGFLGGQGTPTLVFYGYPVIIDLRVANKPILVLTGVRYKSSDAKDGVLLANLLPIKDNYGFIIDSAVLAKSGFRLDLTGKITVDQAFQASFTIDTFKGIPRLNATTAFQ